MTTDGLSKKFCRDLRLSLRYGAKDLLREIFGKPQQKNLRKGEFWALDNVCFELCQGEMLGLIGPNGSGKSTLLKLLNGLILPDSGTIRTTGRVQSLIELGAGFSPILTGRENIYVNAAVLGIGRKQIDRVYEEIVDFADIGDFLDTPVQNYSSGMKARLGFAVVTQLDSDIILIDEVLAVGDTAFQEKCMRRMDALRSSDRALVFVTHSLYQVEALCDKALWLEGGRVRRFGKAGDVVRAYLDDQERRAMEQAKEEHVDYQGRIVSATKAYFEKREPEEEIAQAKSGPSPDKELIQVLGVELEDGNGRTGTEFPFLTDLTIRVRYRATRVIYQPLFNFRFFSNGAHIFEASMLIDGPGPQNIDGEGTVECRFSRLPLTPKLYEIKMFTRSSEGVSDLMQMRTVAHFRITDKNLDAVPLRGPMAINHLRQGSPVYIPRTWRFYKTSKCHSGEEEGANEAPYEIRVTAQ